MARLFLDTNIYIDVTKRKKQELEPLRDHLLFISPLSTHILFYAHEIRVPDEEIKEIQKQFGLVPLTKYILDRALDGPTKDLEDNIQLHSAAEAECDYFLTNDEDLLKMKFFGKTQLIATLPTN